MKSKKKQGKGAAGIPACSTIASVLSQTVVKGAKKARRKVAEDLSANQLDEFKGVFAELEKDGDGSVTTKKLGAFLRSIGQTPTHAELQDMILEIDQDGIGLLCRSGFFFNTN